MLSSGAVGAGVAIGIGVVRWFSKASFEHILDRKLETFRGQIKRELNSHSIRFAKLHETRAEVIRDLYLSFGEVQSLVQAAVLDSKDLEQSSADAAIDQINQLHIKISEVDIYLPKNVEIRIRTLLNSMIPIAKQPNNLCIQPPDIVTLANRIKELNQVRLELKSEFRELLGIDKND